MHDLSNDYTADDQEWPLKVWGTTNVLEGRYFEKYNILYHVNFQG